MLINLELSINQEVSDSLFASFSACTTVQMVVVHLEEYWGSKFHGLINLELSSNLEVSGLLFAPFFFFACTTVQIVVMDLEEYWRYLSTGF